MATYYFRNAGTDWGTAANWSLTSGGGATGAVPDATHDAIFDANSGPCTVNALARTCKTLTFTGYANTITMSNQISVSGNITLQAGLLVAGTGKLLMIITGTLTPNGFSWPNDFEFKGTSQTYTLATNFTVLGQLTCSGATLITINSNTLYCNGGVFTTTTSGTTAIELTGGNWSGGCNNTISLNTAGTITLTGNIGRVSGTLTYVTGTINNSGNYSLGWSGGSINVGNNIIWNNITVGTGTNTLVSDLHATGNFITGNGGVLNGAYKVYCSGITENNSTVAYRGTATVELTGTGSWTGTTIGWALNIIINCGGANTLTIAASRVFGASTFTPVLTYTSGTVVCSGFITFYTSTLATNGMTFNSVRMGTSGIGVQTITLSNNMTIAGDFTILGNGNTIINGNQINIAGSLINSASSSTSSGTTILNLNGTGSISTTGTPTSWTNPITINTTSGTITWSGINAYNGNLTYTAGTIVSTSSILNRSSGTMTINASGFNLGILNLLGTTYFLGSSGFTITTLNCTTAGVHSIWQAGNEYVITDNFISGQVDAINRITYTSSFNRIFTGSISGSVLAVTAVAYGTIAVSDEIFATGLTQGFTITSFGSGTGGLGTYSLSGAPGNLTSRTFVSTPGTSSYPKITLNSGAYQNLYFSNALDIDSLNGQTIWTFQSNLLRAFNWALGSQPTTFSYTWVS